MNTVKTIDWIALLLIVIGAINWGLVGFFQYDLVGSIFGGTSSLASRIVYAIVGIAGIYGLTFFDLVKDICPILFLPV